MVRHFDLQSVSRQELDDARISRLTGYLASSWMLGQLLSSIAWGAFSDQFGRRPVLILGQVSQAMSLVAFGLAPSFPLAFAARLVGGLLNGVIGSLKCSMGEVMSVKQQTRGFAIFSTAWGLGTIIGPILAGVGADPCGVHRATVHPSSSYCSRPHAVLVVYPYALPCILAALISLLGAMATIRLLEETHPAIRAARGLSPYCEDASSLAWIDRLVAIVTRTRMHVRARVDRVLSRRGSRRFELHRMQGLMSSMRFVPNAVDRDDDEAEAEKEKERNAKRLDELPSSNTFAPHQPTPWHRDQGIITTIIGYMGIAFIYCVHDELTPVFASTRPEAGGLGLTTSELSIPLALAGVVLMFWAAFGFPWLTKRVGVKRTCQFGCLGLAVGGLLVPLSSWTARRSPSESALASQILLSIAVMWKAICNNNSFAACIIMVNAATVLEHGHMLGKVNGAGQTVAALMRSIGPAIGGLLFSVSVSIHFVSLSFLVVSLIATLIAIFYRSIHIPGV